MQMNFAPSQECFFSPSNSIGCSFKLKLPVLWLFLPSGRFNKGFELLGSVFWEEIVRENEGSSLTMTLSNPSD